MPVEFLAKHIDRNYAKLARQVKNKSLWLAWVGPFTEYALAPALGLISGFLLLAWPWLVLALAYPLVSLGDLHLWRRVYGRSARGVSYHVSFLANFDLIYLFAVGYVIGRIAVMLG